MNVLMSVRIWGNINRLPLLKRLDISNMHPVSWCCREIKEIYRDLVLIVDLFIWVCLLLVSPAILIS